MLSFTVKNLLRAYQGEMNYIEVRRIREDVHTAYDPVEDTVEVCSVDYMSKIPAPVMAEEVQDFYIERGEVVVYI
jgi:hypothetical protein